MKLNFKSTGTPILVINKKGVINIGEKEGYGKNSDWRGNKLQVKKCHHNFPKFPVPETTILRRYDDSQRNDGEFMRKQKENLNRITKYILCQTLEENE